MSAAAPDFLLLGASGFLGVSFFKILQGCGFELATSTVRLADREGIERLLDERPPKLGVICTAGERGRPNISWCDAHPVETMEANVTGHLVVATACKNRRLHVTLIGTGALYEPDPSRPGHLFTEQDSCNIASPGVYVALRVRLEELLSFFDNVLVLRVNYPISSNLDPRGLIGKLARFQTVDRAAPSVSVLEDLVPLIPDMVKRRTTGVVNFVNKGGLAYADVLEALKARAPRGWTSPVVARSAPSRPAATLDVSHFAASCGREIPDSITSVRRIIADLKENEFAALVEEQRQQKLREQRPTAERPHSAL